MIPILASDCPNGYQRMWFCAITNTVTIASIATAIIQKLYFDLEVVHETWEKNVFSMNWSGHYSRSSTSVDSVATAAWLQYILMRLISMLLIDNCDILHFCAV